MREFTGYPIELENREAIYSRGAIAYKRWRDTFDEYTWEPPKAVDPRDWFKVENQFSMGSCQGQSLTDDAEFCHVLSHGEPVQLSRAYAYLHSQKYDNLLGRDTGSTLNGGTKAVRDGIPLEAEFQYSDNYRAVLSEYRSNKAYSTLYKLRGEVPLPTWEDAYRFLSSWQGCIQIGIMWTLGDGWEVKSYRFSRSSGGHAVSFVGYLPVSGWPGGIGFLLKNSWGTNWGRGGYALVHPNAYNQMFAHDWNIAIGRSDMPKPVPRVESIDAAKYAGIA